MGVVLVYRDAKIEDLNQIVHCICSDLDSRYLKKEEDTIEYDKEAIEDFISDSIKTKFRYFCVYEENGEILGGQLSLIEENPFRKDLFLSDKIWFTSPKLSNFKRLMVAYRVLKGIPEYMNEHCVKLVKGDLHSTDGKTFPTAARKLLEKLGYKLMFQQYMKAI